MFRLATLSLANRALIALVTIFAAIFGVISMGSLKQELIPSLEFPQVSVLTTMQDASAEVVDAQVSRPLEAALNGVENLESSSATSRSGLSTITLTFPYGTNLDRARNQIDRAITTAKDQLPKDVSPQSVAGNVSDFPILYFAVASDKGLSALNSDLQRLTVPKLLKVDGVRDVQVTGANGQHISIQPDPAKLAAANASISSISDALKNNGGLVPAGTITDQGKSLSVQVGSHVSSLDAVKGLPLASAKPGSEPATIGSVATVSLEDDATSSITRTNGKATLALSVTKKPDADTVTVSQAVENALPDVKAELGSNASFTTIFNQAPFIEKSIKDLGTEGLLGLGFAVLVILLFLLSVRSTIVTAISIPLSLLITLIGLWASKYSLNILTLGALTIAIGRVVDDSIVVIENIKRHQSYGEDKLTAIKNAIREVAGAITASTLTTVAVFAPIAFVGNIAGELFRPFALTVTIALIASLLVSLTIVPVLAYWFLGKPKPVAPGLDAGGAEAMRLVEEKERKGWLQRGYLPVLRTTQKHPWWTVSVAVIILIGTLLMAPLLPQNLLGDSGQNSLSVTQTLPAGTSLQSTSDAAKKVEDALKKVDGVEDLQVTVGTSSNGLGFQSSSGSNVAAFQVVTNESKDQEKLKNTVQESLSKITDAGTIKLGSSAGLGTSSTVGITIKASSGADLQKANDAVVQGLQGVPDVRNISSNLSGADPLVRVTIDRAKVVSSGLNEQQVAGLLAATVSPVPGGIVRLDTVDYKVQIGKGTQFSSIDELKAAQLPTPAGPIALSSVATVEQVNVPVSITSSNGQRSAKVSLTPSGDNLAKLSADVESKLSGISLPGGASAALGGATTQQREAFQQLGLALVAAVAIVYVIMVATFKSLIQPLLLLVSIPFAATGAIGLLLITQVPLGLPSLIGMLMLVGIVVTNAIVLIDLINQARQARNGKPGMSVAEAIEYGARHRLRPILMTALATVFALVPMALGVTGGGGFISQPLAIVVIGGLISSTLLTLVLVPVLYKLVEGSRERRALLKELQKVPETSGSHHSLDTDWTTGAIPKIRGRRSAGPDATASDS